MATIAELRDAYPDFLKDKSDTDIVRMLAEKDGLSLPYVAYELGLDPNQYIQNTGRGQDLVNQGILGLGDIVSGVAGAIDIPIAAATGSAPLSTAVDWAADATGLGDYGKRLGVTMSPQSQQTRATMDRQWNDQEAGVWDKTKNIARTLWDDPYYALELGARSASTLVPAIGGVKLLGMGAKALEAAGLARTASGLRTIAPGLAEGGVAAGYQMNNLLEEDVDPREAAGYSALTGVGTGVIGGVTGALGARAGLTDPHRALAGYRLPNEAPALPWYQRIPGGMALEAGQEALQSPWEQAVTNVATGQPWDQGLARSAVEGALAGGIIGAPFNVFRGREIDLTQTQDDTEANPPDPTKGLDTTRFNAPSDVASVRNQVGLNTAEGLSNWAGVRELGDTAGYTGDLAGAYNEPSGHRVADKATGVERELSMGDWLYYQATGQLPPTTDPVKVEGKPKPIEGVTPELQRLLDVARNLPMAADPAKIKPGEVTANGHSQKGRPSTKAVEWATKLAGLKTVDEVNKAVEKGTRSKAGYWQWVMPMALARIQEIQAEQAKQSAANTGQPNPETSTEADAQTRVNPTTSSVVAPEGASAVPESGPPPVVPGEDDVEPFLASLTPAQHARTKELGIRKMKDLDIALKAGELDTPPVSPTPTETVPNALSGQTTPQTSQTPGTTPPAPPVPGVTNDLVGKRVTYKRSSFGIDQEYKGIVDSIDDNGNAVLRPVGKDGNPLSLPPFYARASDLVVLDQPGDTNANTSTLPSDQTRLPEGGTTPPSLQASQTPGTTAPDATAEPGVTEVPPAPTVTPTGRKRRETPPPPKAQGKSAVAPGMGKTTMAPTSAEAPSMEFLTDRDAVSAKVREQYGNIVSSLPILSKPKNQIRLRSEEDRGPVTEMMVNAFIDYMNTLVESRGVGEADQGLRSIATEISDSINQSGSLVRKDGQPTTVSHTWVGNQLKLLASKAKTDPTLAALSARAQALRISEAAAEAAERGDALDSDMKTVDINDAERMGLDDEKAAAPTIDQAGDAVLEEEPDEADTPYLYDNAVNIQYKPDSGAKTDATTKLSPLEVSLWVRANEAAIGSQEDAVQELRSLPEDYRSAIISAVEVGTRRVASAVAGGKEDATGPYVHQAMDKTALFATLRGIRARYLADRERSNQTQPTERDVYTPPPVASSYFGDKYEQFRGGAASLAPFAELEKVLKPAVLKQYEYMWDSATTVETQSALAARINKTYETARARQPRPDQQPAAAQSQPVAADEPVNQDRDGQAVVGGKRAGEGAGVPGPDRGPGVGGVRRAGDTGQGQGAGRAVAERGQPAGGIDIPAPERLVANKLAKGASPRKVTRPMARIWQEAANQDPISDVSNMSEGTAQQELEEVNAVLATQGVDGVAAWMNPVNRAMGITKLRRELLDKAKQAAQAEPQVQQGLGEDVAATNPTTERTLRDTIASLLGKGHNWRIHVYATPEEAHAAGHTPRKVGNAYGWVEADQKGVKHAYFIVNRIEQGTELGKFLHEVGAHIGLENILSEKEYTYLHDKILDWFVAGAAGDVSVEAQAALSAAKRVKQAKQERERAGGTYTRAEEMSELIAYFVEEAVNTYGVDPTAGKISGRLAEWFRKLITAFKRALGKLNIDNLDALTPQDVVDLAYGAARLSLVERKNVAPQRVTEARAPQYGVDVPSHVSAISEAVQNQLSKGETGVKSNLLGWLRLDQLADQYGKQIPMVAELNKLFNQMSAKTQHWLGRADQVIRMWDMLTPKQKELMHWIMGNATVEGYDPDDSQTTAKNDQQRLLDQKWQQLQALDAANPKMKAATVYRAARKHYQDDMQEAIDYLNGLKAQAKGANDKQLDSMITTLKALTKKSKGVYFPLMRFGDFYTVGMSSQLHTLHQKRKGLLDQGQALDAAEEKLYQKLRKDAKHYQVTGHDSERQARKHAEKLRAQGMQATSNVGRYTQDAVRNTLSKDMEGFNKILAELEVPKGVASRLQDAYESLLIDALPEGHTLKRQMDRDGIAGWDTDMRRVFAKSTQSRAFALSRLINLRQVQEQMAKLKRAGESFEPNAQLASPLYNELMKRQELAYTRSEDPLWTRVATTWNYLTMLSFSPAFWLLNLSQVPVVTLPWLASRNGNQYGATMTGLAKAAGQTAKMIKWSIEGNEWRAELDTTRTIPGLTQDEKQLLLDMQDAGKLEFTIGQDLGAVAAGKSDWVAKLTRSINTPTHATELINRAATALTAYRISRKNQNDHAKAVEFAIRASDTTHVNYDPVVGARNMQTVFGSAPLAKIVFQFWKFQQGMAYLALSTLKDAYNHPDPAVKKQARDTAIGMTLTLTSTAGAFGLPFVGSALGLLTLVLGMFGDDDEDKDVPRMIKNWMHDYLPGPVEDYLTKGIWGLMDGPDPSARFSMGGLMNPLAFARFDDTQRGEDTVKEIMFRVFGGATGASASAVLDGLTAVGEGDYAKAGEKLLPLKLLRDLSKAYTLNTEGLTTGKGEQRLDPNDFSVADSLWQAMGIQPAKKTTYYDRQAAIQSQKQAVEGTRDKLLAEYGQARLQGKDVSPIVVQITRFNQRNPHARIKAENLRQAVDRRRTNRRETDATGMLVNKQTRPYLPNARWTE